MTISLFSGQGSQYPGMGRDVAESDSAIMKIFETGSEILGRDLKAICFDSEAEELSRTINAQPAIMASLLPALHPQFQKAIPMMELQDILWASMPQCRLPE